MSKLSSKHIHLDVSTDEFEPTRAEMQSLATYDRIKEFILDKFEMKVSTLYISQVKRAHGLEMRPNYNLSKSPDYKVPRCPDDKWAVIEKALSYFKLI